MQNQRRLGAVTRAPMIVRASYVRSRDRDDGFRDRDRRVQFLNNLYYSKYPSISGEELANLIEMKCGRLYKPEIYSKKSWVYFRIVWEVQDSSDMRSYNKAAEILSRITHKEAVKSAIWKAELIIENFEDSLIEIRFQN